MVTRLFQGLVSAKLTNDGILSTKAVLGRVHEL